MHTKQDGLMAAWKIRMYRNHYAVVFVWESDKILQERCAEYGTDEGVRGMAHAGACGIDARTAKVSLPKKFGEIHLVDGKYGSGLVAHEIQHLVNYWVDRKGWNISVHDEKLAMLAMRMTTDFWRGHYAVYPEVICTG